MYAMNKSDWSKMIDGLRETGMTQASIARRIGLSRNALSEIRTGRTAEPRGMAAVKLYLMAKSRGLLRKAA